MKYILDKNYENSKICLRMFGGIGDVIIMIASSAKKLKEKPCKITAAVAEYQIPLIKEFYGVDSAIDTKKLNSKHIQESFDFIIDFQGVVNTTRSLKTGDYYDLVSKRLGFEVDIGSFRHIKYTPVHNVVCLHPNASNPNREWPKSNWEELALQLEANGYEVWWLGTKLDYGFNSKNIIKLSDISDDIIYQTKKLATVKYFIGNDSGFCHIAGVLGVPGKVIFGNTHPQDVIARYPNLNGIHNFREYSEPSRSLNKLDIQSINALESVSVTQVLAEMGLYPKKIQVTHQKATKMVVGIVGSSEYALKLKDYLLSKVEVGMFDNINEVSNNANIEILLLVSSEKLQIRKNNKTITVDGSNFENIIRALTFMQ